MLLLIGCVCVCVFLIGCVHVVVDRVCVLLLLVPGVAMEVPLIW